LFESWRMGAGLSSRKADLILRGVWKASGSESNMKDDSWVSPTYFFDFDYHDESSEKPERTFRLWKDGFEDTVSYGSIARIGADLDNDNRTVYESDSEDPEERRTQAVLVWKLVTEKKKSYYFKATVASEFREDTAVMRGVYGTLPDFTGPPVLSGRFTYDFWRVSPLSKEEIEERRCGEPETSQAEGKPAVAERAKGKAKHPCGLTFGKKLSIAFEVLADILLTRAVVFVGFFGALLWPTYSRTGKLPSYNELSMMLELFGVPVVFLIHLMSGWVSSIQQALSALVVGQDEKEDCQAIEEPWWLSGARVFCILLRCAVYAAVGWAVGDAVSTLDPQVALLISTPLSNAFKTRTGLPTSALILIGLTVVFDLLKMSALGVRIRHNGVWGTAGVCSICRLVEPLSSLLSTLLFVGASGAVLYEANVDLMNSMPCIMAVLISAVHFSIALITSVCRDTALIEANVQYVQYAVQTKKLFFFFI